MEIEWSWKAPVAELVAANGNLARKNSGAKANFNHRLPEQRVDRILGKAWRIVEIMGRIQEWLK